MPNTSEPLDRLMDKLKVYLYETLGITLFLERQDKHNLPYFLQESFDYFSGELSEPGVLNKKLMFCVSSTIQPPISIDKMLRKAAPPDVYPVLVQKNLPTYFRRRLIEKRIPFIVPGSQLYLPFVAIDFRERFSQNKDGMQFTSLMQYIFILMLTSQSKEWTQTELAQEFDCSAATASRIFQEFHSFQHASIERNLRGEQYLILKDRRALWDEAQTYLKNPVRRKIYMQREENDSFVLAGESALSAISMLGEPRIPVYAHYAPSETKIFFDKATYPGSPGVIELELWRHQVPLMDGKINPLALYLSLKDNKDERVQSALTRALEEFKW